MKLPNGIDNGNRGGGGGNGGGSGGDGEMAKKSRMRVRKPRVFTGSKMDGKPWGAGSTAIKTRFGGRN